MAETMFAANPAIYFIDLQNTQETDAGGFFRKPSKQLMVGAPGYSPKKAEYLKRAFYVAFDGLIFIKNISPPTYTRL